MSIIPHFLDFQGNYNLKHYFDNLGSDFVVIVDSEENYRPLHQQANCFANFIGRLPLLGRVFGPVRASYGVVKASFCGVGAGFALISAGVMIPFSRKISVKCLYGAEVIGHHSVDGLKHFGRGIIETIPVVGCYQFVTYDSNHIFY